LVVVAQSSSVIVSSSIVDLTLALVLLTNVIVR